MERVTVDSEYTATVAIPSSLQARMIRTAILPRLAIRIFESTPYVYGDAAT